MNPYLSSLGIETQTVIADLEGLPNIISNDSKRRCQILRDENNISFIYYLQEQQEQAQKLYLDLVPKELKDTQRSHNDSSISPATPLPPHDKDDEMLNGMVLSSALTTWNKDEAIDSISNS